MTPLVDLVGHRGQPRVSLDHQAAVATRQGQPRGAALQSVGRSDLDEKPIGLGQYAAQVVDDAVLAVLAESRELPGLRVRRVDHAGLRRGGAGECRLDAARRLDPLQLVRQVAIECRARQGPS